MLKHLTRKDQLLNMTFKKGVKNSLTKHKSQVLIPCLLRTPTVTLNKHTQKYESSLVRPTFYISGDKQFKSFKHLEFQK